MIIRSIRLDNFGLYAGKQCIEPSTSVDGGGAITLVGGLNGRGKTSLLEAVLLTLYGNRTPVLRERVGGYFPYLESLIHKGTDRKIGSSTELVFELLDAKNDGQPDRPAISLRVRRSWRVANKRVSERLEVWRNGFEDSHLATNWNNYVEELIPSGVSSLFFFDGEKIATLAEEEETTESLRLAIQSLLGLDLVDKLIVDLKAVMKRSRSKLRTAEGADIVSRLDSELTALNQSAQRIEQAISGKRNEVLRAEAERRKKEDSYLRAGGTLAQSRAGLQKQGIELQGSLDQSRELINQMAAGPLPLLLVEAMLKQIATGMETAEQVQQAKAILPLLKQRDSHLLAKLAEHIPDFTELSKIADFLETDRADLEARAQEAPAIQLSGVGQGQLAALIHNSQQLRDKARLLSHEYHVAEKGLAEVSRHLLYQYDEDAMTAALKELSSATQVLATREQEMKQLNQDLDDVNAQIKQTEQRYKAALEQYIKQLDTFDDAQRTIDVANRSLGKMESFKQQVTQRKIHALEEAVTIAFDELTHKMALATSIRIHPETLKITLHDTAGREIVKSRLSSGEKQMLAVSILWGLARASNRNLPVIIDTPMGRLDSSHRMNFVTRYLPNASHQVIVLSTDTEIVGPYLDTLNGTIGSRYLLSYDEEQQRTSITPGYFPHEAEGASA